MLKSEGHKDREIKRLKWLLEEWKRRYDEAVEEKDQRLNQARAAHRRANRSDFHFMVAVPVAFVAGVIAAVKVLPL